MQWVSRITKALEENHCLRNGLCQLLKPRGRVNTEVLLRLEEKPAKSSPMAFIPAAERYQLMHLIDRWVISTLLPIWGSNTRIGTAWVQNWPSLYAVNLSGASINDEQFINFVQEQFAFCRIRHQSSAFVETVVTNLGKAAQFMSELKALGCHFALDDFGSGCPLLLI